MLKHCRGGISFFSKRGTFRFLDGEVTDVNSRDNIGMRLVMNATVPYLYRAIDKIHVILVRNMTVLLDRYAYD